MKFKEIKISNFRQYFGAISLDLSTNSQKNIVLVGGKNGYGKTNLLLSIVWCLFGDRISLIDDHFKREIQKEKNYSLFMKQSLNWTARNKGDECFSVEILLEDIDLPIIKNFALETNNLLIKREFNVNTMEEKLSILDSATNLKLVDIDSDKLNFINDFIIPLDAAKFVFFDAEKISEIANFSIKDEGNFINDALGKILGLDIYETLIEDLEFYANNLKKEGADKNIQEQIIDTERAIEIYRNKIVVNEEENAEKQKTIDEIKKEIRAYESNIALHSKNNNPTVTRQSLVSQIAVLQDRDAELSANFNDLSEIIPLAILTGKLEEVSDHLSAQDINDSIEALSFENSSKMEVFLERLFNQPPDLPGFQFSLKEKMFYLNKAEDLVKDLFEKSNSYKDLEFEHDLNNSEKSLIIDAVSLIDTHSKEVFETAIDQYNSNKTTLNELSIFLRRIDSDLEDEIVLEYTSKKDNAERQIADLHEQIGINKGNIEKLQKDIVKLSQTYQSLLKKVEINHKNRLKIAKCGEYLDVLKVFIDNQKELKKDSLQSNILMELKRLMHKLNSATNTTKFIENVTVTILANRQGMRITLYDQDSQEIRKETLSSGEKQIYISCLIKAILNESVQDFPIFIDTPLGRLDDEHRDNITKIYYPDLSKQVILFSTNSEITPRRFKDIHDSISRSYLIVNDGINSRIKEGYFQTYENQN